jgi:ParB family chromosome partitioning protein
VSVARRVSTPQPYMAFRPLDSIRIGKRHRKDLGDVAGLAASIKGRGLLHPVVVTGDGLLIAGERRLAAVRLLGWPLVPVTVIDIDDVLLGERDENSERLDLSPTEAVDLGRALEVRERELAKERQGRSGSERSVQLPERSKGQVRDRVGKAVGLSGSSYHRAKAVVEAAEQDPEKYGDLAEQMDRTGKVEPAYRELQAVEKITSASAGKKRNTSAVLANGARLRSSPKRPVGDSIERGLDQLENTVEILDRLLGEADQFSAKWAKRLRKIRHQVTRLVRRVE